MLSVWPHSPVRFGQSWRGYTLFQIIQKLGLTSGLKMCFDPGDAASYTSGDKWLDTSGNGYDLFLGSDGATAAQKPTFNGTAGRLSSGEYWSSNGGDFFRYDSANETWMENLHKDNAKYTFLCMYYPAGAGFNRLAGTGGNGPTTVNGLTTFINTSTGAGRIRVGVQGGAAVMDVTTNGLGYSDGSWQMVAVSFDETAGAGFWARNSTVVTLSGSYTSPAATAAAYTFEVGEFGNGSATGMPNGSRFGPFAAWEGVARTASEIRQVHAALRYRFSI